MESLAGACMAAEPCTDALEISYLNYGYFCIKFSKPIRLYTINMPINTMPVHQAPITSATQITPDSDDFPWINGQFGMGVPSAPCGHATAAITSSFWCYKRSGGRENEGWTCISIIVIFVCFGNQQGAWPPCAPPSYSSAYDVSNLSCFDWVGDGMSQAQYQTLMPHLTLYQLPNI